MKIVKKSKRWISQVLFFFASNPILPNYLKGKIYQGNLKQFCVPTLNCYSCPAALGACPIGSLQACIGSPAHAIAFYVLGFLFLFGILLGRFICGFLCPFGLIQDLLYKIKTKKLVIKPSIAKYLSYIKYVVLAVFVIGMPLLLKDDFGSSNPYFCKLICPQGILEGGLPLIAKNADLRQMLGTLFFSKLTILIVVVLVSIFSYRVFCRFICPLGAIYGLFNKISFYNFSIDSSCIHCKKCEKVCKFGIKTYENPNSPECIRCNDCVRHCPVNAIKVHHLFGQVGCTSCSKQVGCASCSEKENLTK